MSIFSPTSSICRAINIGSKCIQSDGPSTYMYMYMIMHVLYACCLYLPLQQTRNTQVQQNTLSEGFSPTFRLRISWLSCIHFSFVSEVQIQTCQPLLVCFNTYEWLQLPSDYTCGYSSSMDALCSRYFPMVSFPSQVDGTSNYYPIALLETKQKGMIILLVLLLSFPLQETRTCILTHLNHSKYS